MRIKKLESLTIEVEGEDRGTGKKVEEVKGREKDIEGKVTKSVEIEGED